MFILALLFLLAFTTSAENLRANVLSSQGRGDVLLMLNRINTMISKEMDMLDSENGPAAIAPPQPRFVKELVSARFVEIETPCQFTCMAAAGWDTSSEGDCAMEDMCRRTENWVRKAHALMGGRLPKCNIANMWEEYFDALIADGNVVDPIHSYAIDDGKMAAYLKCLPGGSTVGEESGLAALVKGYLTETKDNYANFDTWHDRRTVPCSSKLTVGAATRAQRGPSRQAAVRRRQSPRRPGHRSSCQA